MGKGVYGYVGIGILNHALTNSESRNHPQDLVKVQAHHLKLKVPEQSRQLTITC